MIEKCHFRITQKQFYFINQSFTAFKDTQKNISLNYFFSKIFFCLKMGTGKFYGMYKETCLSMIGT